MLCDDLIVLLGRHNLSGDAPTDATRRVLWKAVFAADWDTTCPIVAPRDAPRNRPHHEAATECGVIAQNLPGKGSPVRMANQPAFIKPNVNWDGAGVIFNWVDGRGSGISYRFILAQAKGDCSPAKARDNRVAVASEWLIHAGPVLLKLCLLDDLEEDLRKSARVGIHEGVCSGTCRKLRRVDTIY
ncbi:hypothetical protein B0T16DRAFT_384270 [Cercophora newfieldiana]|uniref:Uncharacterized protein n=1 Tax=Cercophora newfieldiana TaxID=92897 RepID=A0AA39YPI1_9PEZI|nr:hypothetical protein B0T16DRAFT_384270 [Cercophora newfieldiana]